MNPKISIEMFLCLFALSILIITLIVQAARINNLQAENDYLSSSNIRLLETMDLIKKLDTRSLAHDIIKEKGY